MAWIFSKRCKDSLKSGKLIVSFPRNVRLRIWYLMKDYDETTLEQSSSGFNSYSSLLEDLNGKIKKELGLKELMAFKSDESQTASPSNLEAFVLRGNYPPYLIDTVELMFSELYGSAQLDFQTKFNAIMQESSLPWRMAEGQIFPVDSRYIADVVLSKTHELLSATKFEGALHEFTKARSDLTIGDFHGAIQNANLALESTLKGVLGVARAKPGQLFRAIVDSGLIPEYSSGFLDAFEQNILRLPAIIRNEELGAGHGQGKEINAIPIELAEMAVNMTAVLVNYLIKRHIDARPKEVPQAQSAEDDLPF